MKIGARVLLLGPSTGSKGVFGNATIANSVRNAASTMSTIVVIVGLLVAVTLAFDVEGKKKKD